jgi:hypothetical protein
MKILYSTPRVYLSFFRMQEIHRPIRMGGEKANFFTHPPRLSRSRAITTGTTDGEEKRNAKIANHTP